MPSKATIIRLAKSIGKIAAAGALTALAAYATGHQAQNPALFALVIFAIREADHFIGQPAAS